MGHGDRFLVPPLLSDNSDMLKYVFCFISYSVHVPSRCTVTQCGGVPYRLSWLKPLLKGWLRKLRFLEGRLPGVRGEAGMAGRL